MEVIDAVQEQVDIQAGSKPNVRTINMDDPRAVHAQAEPEPPPEEVVEPVEKPEDKEEVADATSNLQSPAEAQANAA